MKIQAQHVQNQSFVSWQSTKRLKPSVYQSLGEQVRISIFFFCFFFFVIVKRNVLRTSLELKQSNSRHGCRKSRQAHANARNFDPVCPFSVDEETLVRFVMC